MCNIRPRLGVINKLMLVVLIAVGLTTIVACAPAAFAVAPSVAKTAEKAEALVLDQNLAGLAKLNSQLTLQPSDSQLHKWLAHYLKRMNSMATAAAKTYQKQCALAKKSMAKANPVVAFEHMLAAYAVCTDKPAFKKKTWVIKLVNRTASKAAAYNRTNHFLDALELYTQLNRMYKISMRFYTPLRRTIWSKPPGLNRRSTIIPRT